MFTITCITIICVGACYTGFHAWSAFGESFTEQPRQTVQHFTSSAADFEQPIAEDLAFGSLTYPLSDLLPETQRRRLQQTNQLAAAGFHAKSAWNNLNAVRFVLIFASVAAILTWMLFSSEAWNKTGFVLLLLVPITAWAVPGAWLASQASERTAEVERSLPDLIDLLNMGVSQGLPVSSILFRIAPELQYAHPAMAQELSIIKQESEVCSINRALEQFSQRFDSEPIRSFSSLLIQSQTTGTSLSKTLNDYSDNFRSQLRQQIDTKANEASFKLLFPTTLCLLPAVFLFLLGPAIVDVSEYLKAPLNSGPNGQAKQQTSGNQQTIVVPLGN